MGRAQAQQPVNRHRIAVVHPSAPIADMSESASDPLSQAFFQELRPLGYVEGQNLVVERYSGQGRTERNPELARDLVRAKPDLIVTTTSQMVLNFKTATATIPIVGMAGRQHHGRQRRRGTRGSQIAEKSKAALTPSLDDPQAPRASAMA